MAESKPPRKNNPSYYVFLVGNSDGDQTRFTRIGHTSISAPSRGAAAERAADHAGLEIDENAPPSFLVIPATEYRVIQPRVKVERSVSWEPLPPDPAALSVGPTASEQTKAAQQVLGTKPRLGDLGHDR